MDERREVCLDERREASADFKSRGDDQLGEVGVGLRPRLDDDDERYCLDGGEGSRLAGACIIIVLSFDFAASSSDFDLRDDDEDEEELLRLSGLVSFIDALLDELELVDLDELLLDGVLDSSS